MPTGAQPVLPAASGRLASSKGWVGLPHHEGRIGAAGDHNRAVCKTAMVWGSRESMGVQSRQSSACSACCSASHVSCQLPDPPVTPWRAPQSTPCGTLIPASHRRWLPGRSRRPCGSTGSAAGGHPPGCVPCGAAAAGSADSAGSQPSSGRANGEEFCTGTSSVTGLSSVDLP